MPVVAVVTILVLLLMLLGLRGGIGPRFKPRKLMNKSEARLFTQMRNALPPEWSVMSQVSYGAFLSNPSNKRFRTVMSKRADFLIADPSFEVAAVLEYHGGGHFGRSPEKRAKVQASDATKRKAMSEAGIPFIELHQNVTGAEIVAHMLALVTTNPSANADASSSSSPTYSEDANDTSS